MCRSSMLDEEVSVLWQQRRVSHSNILFEERRATMPQPESQQPNLRVLVAFVIVAFLLGLAFLIGASVF